MARRKDEPKQDSQYEPIEQDYDGINGQYPYEQHQAPNYYYEDPLNWPEPKIGQKGILDKLIERWFPEEE